MFERRLAMWISVKDRLPKILWRAIQETRHPGGKVTRRAKDLLYSNEVVTWAHDDLFEINRVRIARLNESKRTGKQWWSCGEWPASVIFWMPLPAPPAAEIKEGANLHPPTPQGQNAQSSTSPVA